MAVVDTGSELTIVSGDVLRRVYGPDFQPTAESHVYVSGIGDHPIAMPIVPLLVGLPTSNGETVTAQVDCVVADVAKEVLLGANIMSLLGLELRVDYRQKRVQLERYTWERFEEEVASLYRSMGASVKQNLNLGGFQVDLLAEEETQSGQRLRLLVECKFYKDMVGNRVVNDFARVVASLRESHHVDRGAIVAHRGFTQDATLVAQNTGIELVTLDDLRQRVPGPREVVPPANKTRAQPVPSRHSLDTPGRFFVVMPFLPEMEDVYHLGIRETVQNIGGACERADEIQHTGGILQKIYDSIHGATIIIAEVSQQNPNVFYEIGFAHALDKPVVLLTRDIASSPFDLRGYNHIVYKSIVELKKSLESMLRQLLKAAEPADEADEPAAGTLL
jgi:hypothetical protein